MSFFEHLTNAWRSIMANKLRTTLSSLGIIIWVSSVIILLAFGEGTQKTITANIESLGTNLLTITPGGVQQNNVTATKSLRSQTDVFTLLDAHALEWFTNIVAISPQVQWSRQILYNTASTRSTVYGVIPSYLSVRNSSVAFGNFISQKDDDQGAKVAVLGSEVIKTLFSNQDPLGKKIRIWTTFFTVIGTMKEKWGNGFSNADNAIFIPLSTAQYRVFGSKYISQIGVTVLDAKKIGDTKQQLISFFLRRFAIKDPNEANFQIFNSADSLSAITSITDTLKVFLWGIAAISLLVWGIGVMNIMLVTVTERTKEIGIRRAIGALDRDIIIQFLTESIVLTLIGGIIGILVSEWVVALVNKLWFAALITLNSLTLSFVCAVSVGIVFGILPAYNAAKLKPIDALRAE